MIPEFDENGNLPPGVHFCEWEEFNEIPSKLLLVDHLQPDAINAQFCDRPHPIAKPLPTKLAAQNNTTGAARNICIKVNPKLRSH